MKFNCPNCNAKIDGTEAIKKFAAKGGSMSKRKISREAQAKMQAARAESRKRKAAKNER